MRPTGFTGAGLDRADHLRLDPARLAELRRDPRARLLRMTGFDPELAPDGRLSWTRLDEAGDEFIFLGLDECAPLFAPVAAAPAGQRGWNLFRLLEQMDAREAAIWGAARSLNEWHVRHPFCALCGKATNLFRGGWGRRCDGCGGEHFPRVDPVVIMLAEREDRVLVGRQPHYPPGRYSALAGFMEPGESIEEAVARELQEEAGIEVGAVRYVASQPWPFPGSLMIGCLAEALTESLRIDTTELEDARWVTRREVTGAMAGEAEAPFLAPPRFTIAHTLFHRWLEGESR